LRAATSSRSGTWMPGVRRARSPGRREPARRAG
jgi:hypothetical protein